MRWLRLGVALLIVTALAKAPLAAPEETLATYQLGSGWATFGLALPQGAAMSGVQVGQLPTQTDVKTKWPDGSIRFAVVTAKIDSGGSYPIHAATKTVGDFSPTWPDASVTFTVQG